MSLDYYALNRNMLTWEPDKEVIWQPIDYAISNAVANLSTWINKDSGLPLWVLTHPDVKFSITTRVNKVKKALADYEKSRGDKGLNPGEEMIVNPRLPGSKTLPTLSDWLEIKLKEADKGDTEGEEHTEEFPENGTEMSKFMSTVPAPKKPTELKKGWVNPDL